MAYDGRSDEVGNCNLGPVCSPRRFLNPVQFSQHHVAAFCLAGILEANDGRLPRCARDRGDFVDELAHGFLGRNFRQD